MLVALEGFVGVYARPDNVLALNTVKTVYTLLEDMGVEARVDVSLKPFLGTGDIKFFDVRFTVPEKLVVIGGDGTLLRLLALVGSRGAPVIHPIKLGRRGFFFELDIYQGIKRLKEFIEGRYWVEEIMRISIRVFRGNRECVTEDYVALNEAAIVSPGSKTITVRVFVDDEPLYEAIEGDGVIVSTPAGSTAYSLSSGGPIVDRGLHAYVITPINPVMYARPVVVSSKSTVAIEFMRGSRAPLLFIDGQKSTRLRLGDGIVVREAEAPARIARYGPKKRIALPW